MKYMGFMYCKIILLWLRVNGEVEWFMWIIGKVVKILYVESCNWK